MLLRFIGLSFIVPGVVSPRLPSAFANLAAWGDCVAGALAIIATVALSGRASWAMAAVWLFNIEGAVDLVFAFIQGARVQLNPGDLGATYFIVTAIVPPLLVTHALVFRVLTSLRITKHRPASFDRLLNGASSVVIQIERGGKLIFLVITPDS